MLEVKANNIKQMENFETIQKELEKNLSEKRYQHSLGVAKMAGILAKIYGEDEQIAELTGLAHDMAKELSLEENRKYIEENNIEIDEIEKQNPALLHAKIGADMAKKQYGFTNQMQDAIKYHTTANPKMDKLAKIIYVADKIEENRTFEEVESLRNLAMQNLEEAVLAILSYDIKKNIDKGKLLHLDSINTRNAILLFFHKQF